MSNANDCGAPNVGSATPYTGDNGNFGGTGFLVEQLTLDTFYVGYFGNFGATLDANLLNAARDSSYIGFFGNWGNVLTTSQESTVHNNKPVDTFPKKQSIYYKLAGFNTQTQTLENWIVIEEITTRPELFDPTRNPPNVDLSLYLTPPSGHNLVNIKIVARWIQ